ncbi:hypothetical protein [Nocardia camponoti]|uniref:Uncharacterized protein n=1 Tax=Nocardia camponoti TaxID=1616106 RepID=A0A917V874_9NOCA|nr:hypothetical protein [Nocardia camponoti]GGK48263.1 hypothetical protein GCM10011591_19540 [Nocardia camponoti]
MNVVEPAFTVLGLNPVLPAAAGFLAHDQVVRSLRSPLAPLFGRLAAALLWGCGGVATLTVMGVSASVTVPIALTVLVVVASMLALGFSAGLIRAQPVCERAELSG